MIGPRDIVKSQWEASQRGQLTIWTIYDRPEGFIARRFAVTALGPVATADTLNGKLEDIRQTFWKAGLMKLSRQESDEPQIVESWV
jgi:hypothetical protein